MVNQEQDSGKGWDRTNAVAAMNINDGANRTLDRGTTLTQLSANT
jgi:hypothetical protein